MSSPMGRGTEQLVLQLDPLQKHVGLTRSVVSQGQAMTALLLVYSKALHEYEWLQYPVPIQILIN
jgi:hypothetical protein